jgi:hypothetical protein
MLWLMSVIRRFWRYWCGNFDAARKGFDLTALAITVLLAAVCVLFKVVNLQSPFKGYISNAQFAEGCEIVATVVFLGWCFLWLPFRAHEARLEVHQAEKHNLISQVREAEALFNSVTAPPKAPPEPAGPQPKNKAALEAYLTQLEARIVAIKKLTLLEYNKTLKNDEDMESLDLLNEIFFFLDLNLGKDVSTRFKSRPGVTFASINDWGQAAFKGEKWQGMIDCLNHYANQLKQAIAQQK